MGLPLFNFLCLWVCDEEAQDTKKASDKMKAIDLTDLKNIFILLVQRNMRLSIYFIFIVHPEANFLTSSQFTRLFHLLM